MAKVPLSASAIIVCALALMRCANAHSAAAADRSYDGKAIRAHIESIFQAFIDKNHPRAERPLDTGWQLAPSAQ